jgi:hypothetical protein
MAIYDQIIQLSGLRVTTEQYNEILSRLLDLIREEFLTERGFRESGEVLREIHLPYGGGGEGYNEVFAILPLGQPWKLEDAVGVVIIGPIPDADGREWATVVCNHRSGIEARVFFKELASFINEKLAEILKETQAVAG